MSSCSPKAALMIEDIIDGEVKVIEHIAEDAGGIPHPQHAVPVSKI